MLHDSLEQVFLDEAGIEVVGESDVAADPEHLRPHIVIAADDLANVDLGVDMLRQWPGSRVLLIEPRGQHANLFELRPHRTPLGQISLQTLVDIVREAVA